MDAGISLRRLLEMRMHISSLRVLNEMSLDAEFALWLWDDVCLNGSISSRLFTFE